MELPTKEGHFFPKEPVISMVGLATVNMIMLISLAAQYMYVISRGIVFSLLPAFAMAATEGLQIRNKKLQCLHNFETVQKFDYFKEMLDFLLEMS